MIKSLNIYIVLFLIEVAPVQGIMIDPSYKAPIPNARLQNQPPATREKPPALKWQTESEKKLNEPSAYYSVNCGAKSIEKYFFSNPREKHDAPVSKNDRQLNALFSSCFP